MLTQVHSVQIVGGTGAIIDVECHIANGLPAMHIVGMTSKAVDESRERLRAAFATSQLEFPKKKITINLAPADIHKDGSGFDLAIAAALLLHRKGTSHDKLMYFGELGLDGSVKPIRGIIGKLTSARDSGYTKAVIPAGNLPQAELIPDIEILPVSHLRELAEYLNATGPLTFTATKNGAYRTQTVQKTQAYNNDLADVVGQERAKRALILAAAGGHNVLLSGPPGMGKSMLAKTLPGLLPPLTHEEALSITHIHSLTTNTTTIHHERPFRAPHHSASDTSVVGGGQSVKPGEITLANGGVLFLDELPEFKRHVIEALRQPLEDGTITVARAKETVTYPARFLLVATKNPCPCGYFGSSHECSCSASQIQNYNKKISGPIEDRIDIHVTVDPVRHEDLLEQKGSISTATARKLVAAARSAQAKRYNDPVQTNATLGSRNIKQIVNLTAEAETLLNMAAQKLAISPRVYMKIIRLARTIADLEKCRSVLPQHISEAVQYRPQRSLL